MITKRAQRAIDMDSTVEWIGNIAKVESATTPGDWYLVDLDNKRCSCPDQVYRGTTCKHMYKAAADRGLLRLDD